MSEPANFGPENISRGLRAERNQALHRVLKRLPFDFVVALIEGLEAADVIVPGRLFAGRTGGCAVGVTLRALDPSCRGRRPVWGRLRRSITDLRRTMGGRISHLYALEQVFDRSVRLVQARFPSVPPRQVSKAVALWVADEARTELILREMSSDWLDKLAAELTAPTPPAPAPVAVPRLALA